MPPKRPARRSAPLPSRSLGASEVSRNSHKGQGRTVVDEAEDGDLYGAGDVDLDVNTDVDGDSVTGGSPSASASASGGDMREMEESIKRSMAVDAGLRKAQKQQHLEARFEEQTQALEDRIDQRVEEYRRERMRIQDAQLARLLDLSRKKADIESNIIKEAVELADAYDAMKAELEAVLQGRLGDVKEALGALNALEEKATRELMDVKAQ
ncbi:hypothetical protein A1O1_01200 [Capronia coronata CBS 617.96]|uniref:Uncharacterized protein n=1 Tax=Capronia coronata CBS 617.96 TaxID=1182541 RepID=W9ZNL6_9EURO|nr:uncharacterized protein A1O1_01200 [Capronia coronata CBS 617.96]EXJ96074.1 hypothetical protein A1O1_01200 [Capronia coronata CBS 617.96]